MVRREAAVALLSAGLGGLFLLVTVLNLSACLDQCPSGTARCAGAVPQNCNASNEEPVASWLSSPPCGSGSFCVVGDDGILDGNPVQIAFCSLQPTPDPDCSVTIPSSGGWFSMCKGNTALTCESGFLVEQQRCDPGACVSPCGPGQAFCAADAGPDPLCGPTVVETCDGNDFVECACGVRRSTEPCVSPGPSCVPVSILPDGVTLVGCR